MVTQTRGSWSLGRVYPAASLSEETIGKSARRASEESARPGRRATVLRPSGGRRLSRPRPRGCTHVGGVSPTLTTSEVRPNGSKPAAPLDQRCANVVTPQIAETGGFPPSKTVDPETTRRSPGGEHGRPTAPTSGSISVPKRRISSGVIAITGPRTPHVGKVRRQKLARNHAIGDSVEHLARSGGPVRLQASQAGQKSIESRMPSVGRMPRASRPAHHSLTAFAERRARCNVRFRRGFGECPSRESRSQRVASAPPRRSTVDPLLDFRAIDPAARPLDRSPARALVITRSGRRATAAGLDQHAADDDRLILGRRSRRSLSVRPMRG
jgi:hypothetical protein